MWDLNFKGRYDDHDDDHDDHDHDDHDDDHDDLGYVDETRDRCIKLKTYSQGRVLKGLCHDAS